MDEKTGIDDIYMVSDDKYGGDASKEASTDELAFDEVNASIADNE